MLIRLNPHTFADPACLRLALMTNAHDPATRRLWVISTAAPDDPFEIDRVYQPDVIKALQLSGLEVGDV